MLIVLQQQKLKEMRKNEMFKIWECLNPLVSEQVELEKSEVEMLFEGYRQKYADEEVRVAGQEELQEEGNEEVSSEG